ncbi:MAG: DUF814 domain-containing protein [Candidatus Aenigmarchaeota archaeon]|nr:DUF814 domain-containing protein [Candidatus Aenigmarchaeota archaeon]
MEIEIDFRKSAQENAEKYFEEAKKYRKKIETLEKEIEKSKKEIEKLKEEKIEKKEPLKKRKPRGKWYESYRWMFTTEGFLVIGGKDARQNELIYTKRINEKDIVLHADIHGAPLTVVKAEENRLPTPLAIREAAEFAAAYSSAWKSGIAEVDVYWVRPEQVSKQPPPGQFLPKGSFMIYGQKNYLKKMELKLSIGIKIEKNKEGNLFAKVIAGNVQSVNKHAKYFITIIPGDKSQDEIVKEIKRNLLLKALPEDKPLIEAIEDDEIKKMLPPGNSEIVK